MKKLFILLVAAAMILPMILSVSAHYDNECYGTIDLYEQEIVLDGVMDEAYTLYAKKFHPTVYNPVRGEAKPESEYSADFYYLFTDDYKKLNVFIHVHDITPLIPTEINHDTWAHICHTDCVEIKIDPSNACEYADEGDSINEEAYHYRIDASGFVSGSFWGNGLIGNELCTPWVESATMNYSDGYDFELVINTEPYLEATDTTLTKAEDWGIQMMAINVYDPIHYQYEQENSGHRWDVSIYCLNSFTCVASITPLAQAFYPCDFDYILLGKRVGGVEEDEEEIIDPNTNEIVEEKDTANDSIDSTNGSQGQTDNQNGSSDVVNHVGDALALSAMALVLSAGAAYIVSKKRR